MRSRKMMSPFCAIVMSLTLVLPVCATNLAPDNKQNDSYTLGELQQTLADYLDEAGCDLEIGTPEFYEFAVDQLIYGADTELTAHPQYPLIHAYLAEYKLAVEDEGFAKEVSEIQTLSNDECRFYENDIFLGTTIGQIRNAVEAQDTLAQSIAENAPYSYSTYSTYDGAAAAAYAIRYAKSYNVNYPSYATGGGDCTNFVSQALYEGGIPRVGDPASASSPITETTTEWYCIYYSEPGVSFTRITTSWMRVSDFATYMAGIANSAQNYTSRSLVISACAVGSVVQLRSSSTQQLYHSIIISQKASASDVKYCGHSTNRLNEPFSNIDDSANDYRLYKF